jgi:predicted amino acid-binding ACT domain protein
VHHHALTACAFVLEDVEGKPEQGLVADIPQNLSSHGLKVLQSSCALTHQPTAL